MSAVPTKTITRTQLTEGRTGFTVVLDYEQGSGCGSIVTRFKTIGEAEHWIDLQHKLALLCVTDY